MTAWAAALWHGAEVAAWTSAAALALFLVFIFLCRRYVFGSRSGNTSNTVSIAFFHPYWCVAVSVLAHHGSAGVVECTLQPARCAAACFAGCIVSSRGRGAAFTCRGRAVAVS